MNTKIELTKERTKKPVSDEHSYRVAQQYAQNNNIKSMRHWFDFHNLNKGGQQRPEHIPGDPSKYYERRGIWISWSAFLGTNNIATQIQKDEFLDLEQTKQWFQQNKIYTVSQFRELCNSGTRPDNVHSAPNKKFDVKFSDILCPRPSRYLSFNDARMLVRKYGFNNYMEFRQGRRDKPEELKVIPVNPDKFYDKTEEWTSWPDFLGYSRLRKSSKKTV